MFKVIFFFWHSFAKRQAQGFIQSWHFNMVFCERVGSIEIWFLNNSAASQGALQLPRFHPQTFFSKQFRFHKPILGALRNIAKPFVTVFQA